MLRVWCAMVGEGVGGNGKYYRCRTGEWSSSRFFVNMDMSPEASDTTTDLMENKKKTEQKYHSRMLVTI